MTVVTLGRPELLVLRRILFCIGGLTLVLLAWQMGWRHDLLKRQETRENYDMDYYDWNFDLTSTQHDRLERAVSTQGVNIVISAGETTSFTFDFVEALTPQGDTRTVQTQDWYSQAPKYLCEPPCSWPNIFASSDNGWTHPGHPKTKRFTIIRGAGCPYKGDNRQTRCNPVVVTVKNPQMSDSGIYMIGASVRGKDPLRTWSLLVARGSETLEPEPIPPTPAPGGPRVTYLHNVTYESKLALETGYSDRNEWLEWVRYTAYTTERSDCIACAKARPVLGTVPFRLNDANDRKGLQCVISLFSTTATPNSEDCKTLSYLFPSVKDPAIPPSIVVYSGNYTCFTRSGKGKNVGKLPSSYCATSIDIIRKPGTYSATSFLNHNTSRTDLWWLCGDQKLRSYLPPQWIGSCALTQLLMPFQILPIAADRLQPSSHSPGHRITKRDVPGGSFDSHIYIDEIGVPRGVPDDFKARNPVAAGFESLLLFVTVNKNVDWINYIYYNQQRFVNYTRDAVKGIVEQLGPTSLLAWQNRIALDMLLAEKGGVCRMFGDFCCTYIPNNTAPDGSITKALDGLTALSQELAEHSGIDDPIGNWFDRRFGQWKDIVISLLASVGCFLGILVCSGCCLIPCLRTLINRLIVTALSKEKPSPPPYQMPLLLDTEGDPTVGEGLERVESILFLESPWDPSPEAKFRPISPPPFDYDADTLV